MSCLPQQTIFLHIQLDDCLQFRVNPVDGATLCKAMHQKGINLRYLGELAKAISQSEHGERLQHVTVRPSLYWGVFP